MFCTQCGNKMDIGSVFCNKCGTKLFIHNENKIDATEDIAELSSVPTAVNNVTFNEDVVENCGYFINGQIRDKSPHYNIMKYLENHTVSSWYALVMRMLGIIGGAVLGVLAGSFIGGFLQELVFHQLNTYIYDLPFWSRLITAFVGAVIGYKAASVHCREYYNNRIPKTTSTITEMTDFEGLRDLGAKVLNVYDFTQWGYENIKTENPYTTHKISFVFRNRTRHIMTFMPRDAVSYSLSYEVGINNKFAVSNPELYKEGLSDVIDKYKNFHTVMPVLQGLILYYSKISTEINTQKQEADCCEEAN